MALSESVAALGWVAVDEKPTAFVGESAGTGQFYVDKVKMNAKKIGNAEVHRTWAKCLESVWNQLKAYVKEHHSQKRTWNPPKRASKQKKTRVVEIIEDDDSGPMDYVKAFEVIVDGPVAEYVAACAKIGDKDIIKQAAAFQEATWAGQSSQAK